MVQNISERPSSSEKARFFFLQSTPRETFSSRLVQKLYIFHCYRSLTGKGFSVLTLKILTAKKEITSYLK